MATRNNTRSNNNSTRVICQNCGAEVIIPNHEHNVAGIAIGKDSGLGTVILPTVGGQCGGGCGNGHGTVSQTTVTAIPLTPETIAQHPDLAKTLASLIDSIEESGYIDVNGIVRRWLPSQCLQMFYSDWGFHRCIKSRVYRYGWDVLVADLKKQADLKAKGDDQGFAERNQFYGKRVAFQMAEDYIAAVRQHIKKLPTKSHQGRKYVPLRCGWVNGWKGVHCDEIQDVLTMLEGEARKIKMANSPATLLKAVQKFADLTLACAYKPELSTAFINAYKAAGAYYTIKDLILFEGCNFQILPDGSTRQPGWGQRNNRRFIDQQASLEALEKRTAQLVQEGVAEVGYQLLGLLGDFLKYNNFDFGATKAKWEKASQARKALRVLNQNRRPRN